MFIQMQLPQQIIKNRYTLLGVHYNGDADFLDANIGNCTIQLKALKNDTHIELIKFNERNDYMLNTNYKDYKRLLIRQCNERIRMLFVNQINLSFSEN